MKLFVPTIGTRLRLTQPWNFALYGERRNKTLAVALDVYQPFSYSSRNVAAVVTIPEGTVLTVDRIYIRSGNRGFDSMTFRIAAGDCPDAKYNKTRFWARLEECNNMDYEIFQAASFATQDTNYGKYTRTGGHP